jgi:hypothetical protein
VKNAALAYTAPHENPVSLAVAILQEMAARGSACRCVRLPCSVMIPALHLVCQVVLVAVPKQFG